LPTSKSIPVVEDADEAEHSAGKEEPEQEPGVALERTSAVVGFGDFWKQARMKGEGEQDRSSDRETAAEWNRPLMGLAPAIGFVDEFPAKSQLLGDRCQPKRKAEGEEGDRQVDRHRGMRTPLVRASASPVRTNATKRPCECSR